jgi:hypothetical protein
MPYQPGPDKATFDEWFAVACGGDETRGRLIFRGLQEARGINPDTARRQAGLFFDYWLRDSASGRPNSQVFPDIRDELNRYYQGAPRGEVSLGPGEVIQDVPSLVPGDPQEVPGDSPEVRTYSSRRNALEANPDGPGIPLSSFSKSLQEALKYIEGFKRDVPGATVHLVYLEYEDCWAVEVEFSE